MFFFHWRLAAVTLIIFIYQYFVSHNGMSKCNLRKNPWINAGQHVWLRAWSWHWGHEQERVWEACGFLVMNTHAHTRFRMWHAVWPWVYCLTPRSLSFPLCQAVLMVIPISWIRDQRIIIYINEILKRQSQSYWRMLELSWWMRNGCCPKVGNIGASGMVALPKPSISPGKGLLFTSIEAGLQAAKLRLELRSLDSKPCVLYSMWSQSLQLQWQSKVEHAWNRKRFCSKIPVWDLWILEGLGLEDHGTPWNSPLWPYTVCGEKMAEIPEEGSGAAAFALRCVILRWKPEYFMRFL